MALKYLLIYFAIYCTSEGTETVSEIAYQLTKTINNWCYLVPLNAIQSEPNTDTFLVLEGHNIMISVYYNTSTSNGLNYMRSQRSYVNEFENIIYFKCKEGYCSTKTEPSYNAMYREWTFWFYINRSVVCYKNVKLHIRPSINSYNIPSVHVNQIPLHTQVVGSGIKDFDAIACFVYSGNISLNLVCQYSRGLPLTEITCTPAGTTHSLGSNYTSCNYVSKITPEKDGVYLDCIPRYQYYYNNIKYTKDFTTLRIFLIHNGTGSIKNKRWDNDEIKPVSNEDHERCLKYVNCLYDPVTKHQNDSCAKLISKEIITSGIDSNDWKIGVISFVAVLILLASLCITKKYLNWKKNKNAKPTYVNTINVSNELVDNRRGSDSSDHLYCYIDEASIPSLRTQSNSRSNLKLGGYENVNNGNRSDKNHVKFADPRRKSAQDIAEHSNSAVTDDNLYSYVYADRFDILSALRSQNMS